MANVAKECGITIYGVSTGLTPSGIDLGSNDFIVLSKPSVLLLIDEGIASDDAGEIWQLLDVRYGMQVTLMPASRTVVGRPFEVQCHHHRRKSCHASGNR